MADPKFTKDEREAFLADLHVGVISIERDGRAPLTVPIWYDYADGDVIIWTEQQSRKAALIKSAGRFSLCVQREEPPYQYVSVDGPVVGWQEPAPTDVITRIARRYLGDDGDAYLESASDAPTVLIRMRPERWSSMDYSKA
ncbi:pyridoxamine 5'-phosphate oxidase family protein [Fodinicola acaciae]|uniref:pyridoxamine 5'-phosphate oxidase family protein n=1 Tax=Fodinicola acaciae TaxID=2681555 RepID=UPI0013D8344A|nr:pyridoxamine 5'-phosphate oxidase family protein [Fodinicola acaciae]